MSESGQIKETYFRSIFVLDDVQTHIPRHRLYSIFKQYGPVDKLQSPRYPEPWFSSIITIWRTAKSDTLKSQTKIDIEGNTCSIKWIRDDTFCIERLPVAESLLTPPDQESPDHILNTLNDDCLRAIFESNVLSLADLCSIGSVCVRFNEIAKQTFALKHKNEQDYQRLVSSEPLWKVEQYLRIAKNETLAFWNFDECFSEIITENSTNLKRLFVRNYNQLTLDEMRPLFDQLTSLHLSGPYDLTHIFTSNASLEWLQVEAMDISSIFPNIQLPKLKILFLQYIKGCGGSLEQFLQKNNQLTGIGIHYSDFGIERALKHLPNIENLSIEDRSAIRGDIQCVDSDFTCLSHNQLKCLKTIQFRGIHSRMQHLLRTLIDAQISLDYLELNGTGETYPMDEIAQLPAIRCLAIRYIYRDTILSQFIKCFNVAEEIVLFLNRMSLQEVHDALAEIDHSKKIKIHMDDAWLNCDDKVVDSIDKIRRERDIELKVLVKIGVHRREESEPRNKNFIDDIARRHADWLSIVHQ